MSDISVTYLSKSIVIPGMGNITHTHDYWHFCLICRGAAQMPDGTLRLAPACYCAPPGTTHGGYTFVEEQYNINIFFQVHDKTLSHRLESFPFPKLKGEQLFPSVLLNIAEQAHTLAPSQDFLDSAVSYYLHLLTEANRETEATQPHTATLAEQCVRYIEENCAKPLRLEDVARHIGRTPNYTSYLVRSSTGMTVVEHLTAARVRNACSLLAYSSTPIEAVATACGFSDVPYFCRVFKSKIGITPNRYRTSHTATNLYYTGETKDLTIPYKEPSYTYIPAARKCVSWKTPLEYLTQTVQDGHPSSLL